ncbi:transposase domain-containing protein [Streptomyces sp. NPDC060022]|uniref:transposase domain-containing protein n=1 Tax=Streptomyces sp. NPDC060022 TaxID=3347039 RepID=UPI003685FA74
MAITRMFTVAAGRFAPGHLGELTAVVPFELVDAALAEARSVRRRLRDLPSRVGIYFLLAMCLFPEVGYRLSHTGVDDAGRDGTRALLGAVFGPTAEGGTSYASRLLHLLPPDMPVLWDKGFDGNGRPSAGHARS